MVFKPEREVSERQAEVYVHLIKHVEEYGYQPSRRELAELMGITVPAVSQLIGYLINKGLLDPPPKNRNERCLGFRGRIKFTAVNQE